MMVPEEIIIVHGTCVREDKIGNWIEYMRLLTNCNVPTGHVYSIFSTSDRGQNGKSASSIELISAA